MDTDAQRLENKSYIYILKTLKKKKKRFHLPLLCFKPPTICVWNRDFFYKSEPIWIPQLLMLTRLFCTSENLQLCSRAYSLQPDTIYFS